MSEPAGVDFDMLPPRLRQRTWHLVVIDVLVATAITPLTAATLGTAPGLSGGTVALLLGERPGARMSVARAICAGHLRLMRVRLSLD